MPIDPLKLKAVRERRKLTQQQLAELARIPRPHYVRIETGRRPDPRLSTAERIAAALGVKIEAITEERQ